MAKTPEKVNQQQELEQEKQRITKEINRIRAYLEELRVANDGVDPDASERMMNLSIMENLNRRLQSIDYALSALQRGKYGICEDCDQPIEPERLKVLPDTTLCSKCKAARERTG